MKLLTGSWDQQILKGKPELDETVPKLISEAAFSMVNGNETQIKRDFKQNCGKQTFGQ